MSASKQDDQAMRKAFEENPLTLEEREAIDKFMGKKPIDRHAAPQDYQMLERKYYKSKAAPPGHIHLIIIINVPKVYGLTVPAKDSKPGDLLPKKYEAFQVVHRDLNADDKKVIADALRLWIEEKYDY